MASTLFIIYLSDGCAVLSFRKSQLAYRLCCAVLVQFSITLGRPIRARCYYDHKVALHGACLCYAAVQRQTLHYVLTFSCFHFFLFYILLMLDCFTCCAGGDGGRSSDRRQRSVGKPRFGRRCVLHKSFFKVQVGELEM